MWRTLDFNLPELLKPLCPIKTDGTNFFITQKTSLNVKRDEFIIFLDGGTIIKFGAYTLTVGICEIKKGVFDV